MIRVLKERLEIVLNQTKLGEVCEEETGDYLMVILPLFTPNTIKSLWTRIILDLSVGGLANGVLEIPMSLIDEHRAVIWVKDQAIVCQSSSVTVNHNPIQIEKPLLPRSISLAIGGPSGVGKTTLRKRLVSSAVGNCVKTYITHTTRPRRKYEISGADYVFVNPQDLPMYQNDPRFINFVEARGYWYWTDPTRFFESRWQDHNAIHIFTITQVHEFLERRAIMPDLQWVWLHAEETDLRRRLEKRGDADVKSSLVQNRRLNEQDRTGLVSLTITAKENDFESPLQNLLQFITTIQRR